MRTEIGSELALPVTIGIGTNRTLARLAGKFAKPAGIGEILPGCEERLLAHLPVGHLPGAGHAIGRALERYAIRTCGELTLVSREILYASFGHAGLVLYERARGIDQDEVEASLVEDEQGRVVLRPPKSLRRDSTFEPEEGRRELVEAMLCYLVERAAQRLRSFGLCASTLAVRQVHVDTRAPSLRRGAPAQHGSSDPGPNDSDPREHEKRETLHPPSDSTDELWRRARELLRALPRRRALVKRIGLTLSGFHPRAGWQNHLFDDSQALAVPGALHGALHGESRADRLHRLDRTLDQLRAKHGFGRVLTGTSFLLGATHPLGPDGFQLRTPSLNQ